MSVKAMHSNNNPPCPRCQGRSRRRGRERNGDQRYWCNQCHRFFHLVYKVKQNPPCPKCQGSTQRRSTYKDTQHYSCKQCRKWFSFSLEQQRQHAAWLQCEQLPALIEEKLPKNLPLEIREELQQELLVAALAGEFELSELTQVITRYRRKVYRQSLTGFAYVSLDAVIPQTNGLTYADTLAG